MSITDLTESPASPAAEPVPAAPTEADRPAPAAGDLRCAICGGAGHDWRDVSTCSHCERDFHLDIRRQDDDAADAARPDCGAVVMGAACGWSPICNDCLDRIDEAAAAAGHPERLRAR